jgi:putative transposase
VIDYVIPSARRLDAAYRRESDANVRERILLVRRVRVDRKEAASVAEVELHRTRAWGYKWLKRFNEEGLDGLQSRHRSGRPPDVPEEKMMVIKRELSQKPSGWRIKEIMNLIYEKSGVRYHEVHVYRLLHKWGFTPKVPQKRFVNAASKEEKIRFKKRPRT